MNLWQLFYDVGPARFLVFARDLTEAKGLIFDKLQNDNAFLVLEHVFGVTEYRGLPRILREV